MNVPTLLKPSLCSLGLHNSQPQFGRLIIEFLPRLPSAQWPWQWHWNAISQYVWGWRYEWRGNSVLGCSIIPAPAIIIMLLIKSHQCRQIRVTLDHGIMGTGIPAGGLLRYRKWVPQQLGDVIVVANSPPIGLMRCKLTNHHLGIVLDVQAWS